MAGREIREPKAFPVADHWVILDFKTIRHEGDERSRTNPGHGYPSHEEQACEYLAFDTQADWEAAVERRVKSDPQASKWVAFKASGSAVVEVKTTVRIGLDERPLPMPRPADQ